MLSDSPLHTTLGWLMTALNLGENTLHWTFLRCTPGPQVALQGPHSDGTNLQTLAFYNLHSFHCACRLRLPHIWIISLTTNFYFDTAVTKRANRNVYLIEPLNTFSIITNLRYIHTCVNYVTEMFYGTNAIGLATKNIDTNLQEKI